jgi:DNA-binding NarL/FixJ family response regulator
LVQDLAARCPGLPVLMVSMHSEFTHARRALEIGARGYMMKSEDGETLLRAIRTVLRGRIYLGPAASSQLLEYLNNKSGRKRTGIEALSPREFEVFRLIGDGVSTQAIADRLNLSMKTIDTHRARIKLKVGADSLGRLISISSTWLSEQSMTNLPRVVT